MVHDTMDFSTMSFSTKQIIVDKGLRVILPQTHPGHFKQQIALELYAFVHVKAALNHSFNLLPLQK